MSGNRTRLLSTTTGGDGRPIVTGLMCHTDRRIVKLEIETSGRIEPHRSHDFATQIAATQTTFPSLETIECTDNHPIWSADRQAFVPAGELHPGERLSGVAGGVTGGLATLVRCTPVRGPPQLVYNLEVDGEHVYHVGTTGLLVHNACPGNAGDEYKKRKPGQSGKEAANDTPSWARGEAPKVGESGKDYAKRLLDAKYGPGNYPTGPGSEFNKLKKHGDRAFQ